MKLPPGLTIFAFSTVVASASHAAIDGQSLADSYLAEGYDFVEVKVGPTQTKVEAIRGTREVEVVYDNVSGEIIDRETDVADTQDQGRTGVQIRTVGRDFEDRDDSFDDDDDDDDDNRGRGGDDHDDDDHDDDRGGRGGGKGDGGQGGRDDD